MFCFQAAGAEVPSAADREPLLEAGAHHAGVKLLEERGCFLQQLLPLRRIEPGLEIALGVEAQDRQPVILHARNRRFEPVALETRRSWPGQLAMRCSQARNAASWPGLTRDEITAETGAGRTPAALSRTKCTSSGPDQHRLAGVQKSRSPLGTQPGGCGLDIGEALLDHPVHLHGRA